MNCITLKLDGMMCGMCETHVNDAIRNAAKVKKVTSSHVKNEAVIITEEESADVFKDAIEALGYKVLGSKVEPYEKKGLFKKK